MKGIEIKNRKHLFFEFSRYLIVGGLSFILDFVIYSLIILLGQQVYIAAIFGFIAGLTLNYFLSIFWAFNKKEAHGLYALVVFLISGLIGLALTIFGLWILIDLLHWDKIFSKIPVTAVVLIWNYIVRKIFVFNR